MPQIPEYTAQVDALRPTETGVEGFAGAGRRAGAFYNQAAESIRQSSADVARAAEGLATGEAAKARSFSGIAKSVTEAADQAAVFETHREITQLAPAIAKRTAQLEQSWNGIVSDPNTDPNDTHVADRFRETQLEPAFEDLRNAAVTSQAQQFVEAHIEQIRNHFYEKQHADVSTLARIAVDKNLKETESSWSNTARNDPTFVDMLVGSKDKPGLIDSTVTGIVSSSPALTGADAAKARIEVADRIKREVVKAAAFGAIEKAGDKDAAAAEIAKRYPEYVNAQEIDQFAKVARFYQRMDREGVKAEQAEQRRQATAAFHNDANKWELSTIDESGNATLPPDAVKQLKDIVTRYGGDADPGRVTAMVHRVQELGKVLDPASAANLRKTSDATMREVHARPQLPEPDEINRLYAGNKLSYADRNRLLKESQDDRSPDGETLAKARADFFRTFASTIDPGRDQTTGAGASALGTQRIGDATQEARRLEGVLRSQGKDPHALYDPRSPDYFGRPENINRFRPTLQEKAAFDAQVKRDQSGQRAPAAAPPRVSTKADYDRLPSGATFIGDDGKTYRKP